MTFLQVTTQAQEMDKAEEDGGTEGSGAPGAPASLQWDNADKYGPNRVIGCQALPWPEHSCTVSRVPITIPVLTVTLLLYSSTIYSKANTRLS